MKRWASGLTLVVLAGCAQQAPAPLAQEPNARVEVTPPELLQRAPDPVVEVGLLPGASLPVKPLAATGAVSVTPSGTSSVSQVRQITARFDLEGANVPGVAAVEFVPPSGMPYHRMEAAVGVAPPELDRLTFELPVAGTAIDQNKLTGTWSVRLLVGGRQLAAQNFELTP